MLAIVIAAAAFVSVKTVYDEIRIHDPSFQAPSTAVIVVSMLAMSLPLAWRRRFPLTVACVVVAAVVGGWMVIDVREDSITVVAASLAMYSAARHGDRRLATPVLSLCLAAMVAQLVRQELRAEAHAATQLGQGFGVLINAMVLSLPWLLGMLIRTLGEQREQNARQAVFAERVRIARELHDVVAHHVSLMGIQAGAARIVMDRQPEQVAVALGSIEASSRQAVAELHRLLGLLRRPGDVDDLDNGQPGLAQLGDLVEQASQGQLCVDLSIEGPPRVLPPTLDVSAYRIIQEALTNTRKHSGATSAVVRIHYGAATFDVDVVDDGNGHPEIASTPRSGHGLTGMRERTTLHGGRLSAGPRPEGGFAVHATFPLSPALA